MKKFIMTMLFFATAFSFGMISGDNAGAASISRFFEVIVHMNALSGAPGW